MRTSSRVSGPSSEKEGSGETRWEALRTGLVEAPLIVAKSRQEDASHSNRVKCSWLEPRL